MPASRQASGADLPCAIDTSIWRSSVTICSALNLFFGMTGSFPSSFSHNAWSKKARSGHALESFPSLLARLVKGLARFRQGPAQHRPGLTARLLQFLKPCFGFRCVRLNLLDGGIDVGPLRGRDLDCLGLKLIGRLAPSLRLSGGNITECGLLLLDLLADCVEIGFYLRFQSLPPV